MSGFCVDLEHPMIWGKEKKFLQFPTFQFHRKLWWTLCHGRLLPWTDGLAVPWVEPPSTPSMDDSGGRPWARDRLHQSSPCCFSRLTWWWWWQEMLVGAYQWRVHYFSFRVLKWPMTKVVTCNLFLTHLDASLNLFINTVSIVDWCFPEKQIVFFFVTFNLDPW